ncbi:Flp pilus assembly protein CpaB [Nocardiopsis sp. LOL_012]|uniref:Flp pilus assembly protein CpaB n=1 Tax=Nocardiopsis sp. LOL_012 TaxID=3345409 RepID=UPI003A870A55
MAHPPRPHRHRRVLTRLLDRHRRPLAALLAAAALTSGVLLLRPPPPATAGVLVASRDLDASRPLADGDLVHRALPERALPRGALAPGTATSGLRLNAPVRRGEVVTDARLSDPPARAYGPDLVAVPVRVADPEVAGLLSPGSRVDVLAVPAPADPHPFHTKPARRVVGDRPVLAVPSGGEGRGGALVLIAATPDEARELAGHGASSRLSITIRS